MGISLYFLAIVSLIELCLVIPVAWRHIRKPLAAFVIVALAILSGYLVGSHLRIWTVILAILNVYRIINLLRLIEDRRPAAYMAVNWLKTSFSLIIAQILLLFITTMSAQLSTLFSGWVDIARLIDLFMAVSLLAITWRHIRHLSIRKIPRPKNFPSLTIAIPARNETDDLSECVSSLLASTYPKLEIIVLDDCSQNKHTPEIIQSFAHSGVRFIAGQTPPERWLAKNYAYEQLAREANGELILFCGVDCRFHEESLKTIVSTLLSQKLDMVSVLPINQVPKKHYLIGALLQPGRYARELVMPRHLREHPPALSTCWLVRSQLLASNGGFEAIAGSILVESHFARLAETQNGYRFIASDGLGINSQKQVSEQWATAIRIRYPETHHRPDIVAALSFLEFAVITLPFILLIQALIDTDWISMLISLTSASLITWWYGLLLKTTYGRVPFLALPAVVILGLFDAFALNYSMWRYEFKEVIWKDRNVCIPLMHQQPVTLPPRTPLLSSQRR
jgi:glycosyltransferase involved in cell wall biosynthesis